MVTFGVVFLSLGWLMLQLVDGEVDRITQAQGMQLQGDFSIVGLFPIHDTEETSGSLPALDPCNE